MCGNHDPCDIALSCMNAFEVVYFPTIVNAAFWLVAVAMDVKTLVIDSKHCITFEKEKRTHHRLELELSVSCK